jgi:hypothetical protein
MTVNGSTELTVPMSKDAYLDTQVAASFANFDGKMGKFVQGPDKANLPDGQYVFHADELQIGFRKFNGPGNLPDVVAIRFFGADPIPQRPSDETDEGLDGNQTYVWQHFNAVPLTHIESGETFLFSTASKSGCKAIANVATAYKRKGRNALPIVKLEVSSYKHQRFGKVMVPVFVIISWRDNAPAAELTSREILDDDIPF